MKNGFHYVDQKKYANVGGKGILNIRNFGIGDMLISKEPYAVNWYDCRGSVGKYVCLLKNLKGLNNSALTSQLRTALNSGEEMELNTIATSLSEFLEIFPEEELLLTIYDPEEYPEEDSVFYLKFKEWDLLFPNQLKKENENIIRGQYLNYFKERVKNDNWVSGDMLNFCSSGYYEWQSSYFVCTQLKTDIDLKRVQFYEQLIKNGKRPYCLIFNDATSDVNSNYLIDGHHKLLAYKNLKKYPRVLEVSQITHDDGLEFWDNTCKHLFQSLFDCQLEHIFDKGFNDPKIIEKINNSTSNPFKKFIKNGSVTEYWINGKPKSKGNYINNKAVGVVEKFYENGKPKSILYFKEGRVYRFLKSWFKTGELLSEYVEAPDYETGVQINYHKSGKISSRTYFKNGKNANGKSSISYYQDGTMQYEATYEDGIIVNRKYFDRNGKLTEEHKK